jgi:hypothetical protein
MGRPGKTKSPIGLDEWLRRMLPEKRPEDRMKIFREWRRLNLRATLKHEPTDQEVEEEIKLVRERKFGPANYVFGYGDSLRDFVPIFHKENRRKKAQSAAVISWSKENREKRAKKNKKIL